jgi:hypothetical protein
MASGERRYVEAQMFGPGVQNSNFTQSNKTFIILTEN